MVVTNEEALLLLEDYRTEKKIQALQLVEQYLNEFPDQQSNIVDSFLFDAVLKSLSFREIELVSRSLEILLLYSEKNDSVKEKLLDTIVYEINFIDNLELLRCYFARIPTVIRQMGMDVIPKTYSLLTALLSKVEVMDDAIKIAALESIELLIFYSWPVIVKYLDLILGVLYYCYTSCSNETVMVAIKKVAHQMKDVSPEDFWVTLELMKKQDEARMNDFILEINMK